MFNESFVFQLVGQAVSYPIHLADMSTRIEMVANETLMIVSRTDHHMTLYLCKAHPALPYT